MTQPQQVKEHIAPDQLSAFIDSELSSDEHYEMQQHLTGCHECALRAFFAMQLKIATARAAQQCTVPPEALARLTAQLRLQEPKGPARIYSFRSAVWAAVAASLLLAVSLFGWRQIRQTSVLSSELLDQHLTVLSSAASPEVLSTDRRTVKPWFQGKLPFSFNLPDVLPADTTLKGGDLAYLEGEPAALLLFTIHKHEVSVFLTQPSNNPVPMMLRGTQSGFAIHHANTHDLGIAAVSDVNPADLDLLVSAIVDAQRPQ